MSTSHDQPSVAVTTEEMLSVLQRKIVAIHYGLAEHGPTDPKMVVPWALRELNGVLDYIQTVKQAQTPQPKRVERAS